MGLVRPDRPAPRLPPPDYASRVLGCLLGGAVGDAFGYEVEFMRLPEIRRRFGPQGMTGPLRHGGALIVSDDTQMTLFTLEGLLRAQAAGCLAAIVRGLVEGLSLAEATAGAVRVLAGWPESERTLAALAAWRGAGAVPAAWAEGLDCGINLSKMASELT